MPEFTIQQFDLRDLPEPVVRELHDAGEILHQEARPEDSRAPVEQMLLGLRHIPDVFHGSMVIARSSDGRIAGSAEGNWLDVDENKHVYNAGISVLPQYRREGLGTTLLAAVCDLADAAGRNLLLVSASSRVPAGGEFARAVGAELGLVSHENRLDLQELDRGLIGRWLEDAPSLAAGYSLITADSPISDELLPDFVQVMDVMNTAPRQSLELEDMHFTPELARAWEGEILATGQEHWCLLAREDATGKTVGLTDIFVNPETPDRVSQGSTGVLSEHRGHGLGKWLKAAMIQRLLESRPDVRWIVTGNATDNGPMLAINDQLGFKPHASSELWQITVERAREYLAARREAVEAD